MKRLVYLAPVVVLLGLVAAFGAGLNRDPAILPSQLIDRPLPPFTRTGVRDGETGFGSATIRGPALLNVWASWCAACKIEHPVLMQLKAIGVPVYGLAWRDQPADAARVLAQSGDPYTATARDPDGRLGIDLGVTGAPETFIVDKRGRVRFKQVGPITPDVWESKIGPLMKTLRAEA